MYETVANHLQEKAIQLRNKSDLADAFGRSAFNRYYYSTFLRTREMLRALELTKDEKIHGKYPSILENDVIKLLEKALDLHKKMEDEKGAELFNEAIRQCKDLSELIKKAQGVRNISDYELSTKIEFSNENSFELNGVSIMQAKNWPVKAENVCNLIFQAYTIANA